MGRDERSLPALASVLVPGCAGGRHRADCYRGAATVLAGGLAAGGGYRRDRFLSMVGDANSVRMVRVMLTSNEGIADREGVIFRQTIAVSRERAS
jgi:hypothetical protein